MKKQMRWIIIGLLLLSLSSIACSLTGEDDGETAVESITSAVEEAASEAIEDAGGTEAIAEAVEAIAEAGGAEAVAELITDGETISVAELGDALDMTSMLNGEIVQSYRFDMVMGINSDQGNGESIITMLYNSDPYAMDMTMNFTGEAFAEDAAMGEMKIVQIGNSVYMDIPEMGCMEMPATDDMMGDMMSDVFSNEMMNELETLVKVGDETINGVETTHYTFDETTFEDVDDGMETAVGHIYIAKDGGYMVRMILDGTGDVGDFGGGDSSANGTMHIEMNLTSINEPIHIEAPTDCGSLGDLSPFGTDDDDGGLMGDGGEVEYPITNDAAELITMDGLATYSTNMSVADVTTFYQNELSMMGWIENPDVHASVGNTTTMIFRRDGRLLSVSASSDNATVTNVVLFEMDE